MYPVALADELVTITMSEYTKLMFINEVIVVFSLETGSVKFTVMLIGMMFPAIIFVKVVALLVNLNARLSFYVIKPSVKFLNASV